MIDIDAIMEYARAKADFDADGIADDIVEKSREVRPGDAAEIGDNLSLDFTLSVDADYRMGRSSRNLLIRGDNITVMKSLIAGGYEKKIQMIYMDPPFFSGSRYKAQVMEDGEMVEKDAYEDVWQGDVSMYLKELAPRLILMRRLLADDGLCFLHLDWHVVHYARLLMDEIFGEKNFVNEIIWTYKSGGSTNKRFSRKHDNILMYSKTGKYKFNPQKEKSYNRGLKAYNFKGVEEFQDEWGWYTMVNMKDVWHIDMVGRTSKERTGYATQKPEKLMETMVAAATDEGDLVADFFCGSGTLPVAAARMGRSFVACDMGEVAIKTTRNRLLATGIRFLASTLKEEG